MDKLGGKVTLSFLLALALIVDAMSSPVLFDPCPDNGMRKPPRFGKRTVQIDPCVRGPVRRTVKQESQAPLSRPLQLAILDAIITRLKNQANAEYNET